jgi:hypothetical protein
MFHHLNSFFLGLVAPILTRKAAAPIDPEVPQSRELPLIHHENRV